MNMMRPYYEQAVKEAQAKDTPEVRRGVGLSGVASMYPKARLTTQPWR